MLFIAISQSGKSPDLLASARNARERGRTGGRACAIRRTRRSARWPITPSTCTRAPKRSVAATKSFIASLSALTQLVAEWCEDRALLEALRAAPAALDARVALDWSPAVEPLAAAGNLFVLGRGYGLGIAQEAALKLKETCGLHAEAFSSAEVQHGPMALVGAGFPILAFSQSDDAGVGGIEVVEHVGQGLTCGGHLGLTAGVGAQDGGDADGDCHGGFLH